jgi:hypothetical protein
MQQAFRSSGNLFASMQRAFHALEIFPQAYNMLSMLWKPSRTEISPPNNGIAHFILLQNDF